MKLSDFVTTNNVIATTPFPSLEGKVIKRPGIQFIEHTITLVGLTVLAPSKTVIDGQIHEGPPVGSIVYVRGEDVKHQYSKAVLKDDDGVDFILVPTSTVIGGNMAVLGTIKGPSKLL